MRTNLTILALLQAVLAGGIMLTKLPTTREMDAAQASGGSASAVARRQAPPIDAAQPQAVQTATFALG